MHHGKDVLCEKPAARILSEALEMEKVSYETGRSLSIGVCNRYANSVNRIKKMIADGTHDVDNSVGGIVRTDGAVISFNGAWVQNIGIDEEKYIDFMGTKGGTRLMYCGNFTYYTNKDGELYEVTTTYEMDDMQHIRGLKRYGELLVLDSMEIVK